MRTVLVMQEDLVDWLKKKPSNREIRYSLKELTQEVLLCGELDKRYLKSQLLEWLDSSSWSVAAELIDGLCLSRFEDKTAQEPMLALAANSIPDIFFEPAWLEATRHHSGEVRMSESRDDAFERLFGHLLVPALEKVSIIDPFFAAKAIKGQNSATWLMRKLSRAKVPSIQIFTQLPDPADFTDYHGLKHLAKLPRVFFISESADAIDSSLAEFQFSGDFELNLFNSTLHNRYWLFRYSEGTILCEIGLGVDAFASERCREPHQIHACTPDLWGELWKSDKWHPNQQARLVASQLDFKPKSRLKVNSPRPETIR